MLLEKGKVSMTLIHFNIIHTDSTCALLVHDLSK